MQLLDHDVPSTSAFQREVFHGVVTSGPTLFADAANQCGEVHVAVRAAPR